MLPNFIATMLGLVKSHPQCNVFKTRTLLIDSKTNTNIGKSPLFPKYETFADFLSNTIIGKRKHTISEFFYRTQHIQQLEGIKFIRQVIMLMMLPSYFSATTMELHQQKKA